MQRFVSKVTKGSVVLPIDDDYQFLSLLKRFIDEDYKGREAL